MKAGICRKLACGNLRKNYRFFIPRILAETGLLACFYIIFTLACDKRLAAIKGGDYLPTFMWMGAVVIGLLSFILLLYTNSFLMKQRKREFGLYSVLGMEKKHICRVLFYESFFCTPVALVAGSLCGVLFYKLCSLAVCKLLKAEIIVGFYFITPQTILPAGLIFLCFDIFAYLINCVSIGMMKPVDLLAASHTGAKEPKVKWPLLVLGILTLGAGYYIALTTESPLKAILLFFAAVLLVIAGTYFLFIAGSIFVLKALKKNDAYYYRPRAVTAVSGLLYRMKQNAVGLASVAILATGVLVMISTTFCLYARTEHTLKVNFPQDYYISLTLFDGNGVRTDLPEDFVAETVKEKAKRYGLAVKEGFSQEFFEVTFSHKPGELVADSATVTNDTALSNLCNITFLSEDHYIRLGGKPLGLNKNEVAVCPYTAVTWDDDAFTLFGRGYTVAQRLNTFPINDNRLISVNCFGMVVADDAVFEEIFEGQKAAYGANASEPHHRYCVTFDDRNKAIECGSDLDKDVWRSMEAFAQAQGYTEYSLGGTSSFWDSREALYGMFGTLLFLGILLGLVCLFATVLIIYYKQISEGYEDRQRYQIMQKIGMTDKEVKKTIRAQIMLVFFLPLVTAGVHVAFAFPILTKLMEVLLLDNVWLFAKWCIIVYIAFALVYALIYKLTARTYYKIVY